MYPLEAAGVPPVELVLVGNHCHSEFSSSKSRTSLQLTGTENMHIVSRR